jgi:hypothetical protein
MVDNRMSWIDRFLSNDTMRALSEGASAVFLVSGTSVMVAYHAALGVFSLISVMCGAVLGLHAVCRLVLPTLCRRPPTPRDLSDE